MELLSETLTEEKRANELLTSIADGGFNEIATERRRAAELQVKANWTLYGMQGKLRVAVNLVHFGVDGALCSRPSLVVDTSQKPGAGRIRERCALRTSSPGLLYRKALWGGIRGVQTGPGVTAFARIHCSVHV